MKTKRLLLMLIITLCSVASWGQSMATYVVQRGETFSSIAKKFKISEEQLRNANPNVNMCYTGIKLVIPQTSIISSDNDNIQPSYTNPSSETTSSSYLQPILRKQNVSSYSFRLLGEACIGYTNFIWNNGSPKAGFGFGGGIVGQYSNLNEDLLEGYFAELGAGYIRRGSGAYPISYIQAKAIPLGYAFPVSEEMSVFIKIGGYFAQPISKLKTKKTSLNCNSDYGIIGGLGLTYGKLSVTASYEHGFAKVCNSSQKLNNQGIYLSLSYIIF